MECYVRLRPKGQVTIPEDVRETLEAYEGDRLKLSVEVDMRLSDRDPSVEEIEA